MCHRQREATELQLEEIQRELSTLDLAYTQMEQSKHALEERLTEQVCLILSKTAQWKRRWFL